MIQPLRTSRVAAASAPAPAPTLRPSKQHLFLRQTPVQTDCDGVGVMHCGGPYGYCYGGTDGYIGCCQTSSCAARTTCIPYSEVSTRSCDFVTGGCVPCRDPVAPECFTLTNPQAGIYEMYCTVAGAGALVTTNYSPQALPTLINAGPQQVMSVSSDPDISTPAPSPEPAAPESSTASGSSQSVAPSTLLITVQASPTSTADTSANTDGKSSSLSGGAIAGIAVGAAVVVAAIAIVLGCFLYKKRRQKRSSGSKEENPESSNFYKEVSSVGDYTHHEKRVQQQSLHEADPAYAVKYSELPGETSAMKDQR